MEGPLSRTTAWLCPHGSSGSLLFDGTAKLFYSLYKPVREGGGNRTADGFWKLEGTVVGAVKG